MLNDAQIRIRLLKPNTKKIVRYYKIRNFKKILIKALIILKHSSTNKIYKNGTILKEIEDRNNFCRFEKTKDSVYRNILLIILYENELKQSIQGK